MGTSEPGELSKLKQAVTALQQMRAKLEAVQRAKSSPIAIVGMACRFPGGANSPDEYWELLKHGRDAISGVPAGRYGADGVRKIEAAGVQAVKCGGFLDRVDEFDASFFGIAPREAVAMDPQQRILLEVVWEALEAGGFPRERLTGSRTGVFVGMCSHSVDYYMLQKDLLSPGSSYVGTGTAHNLVAGRVSYWFDWHAPSIAVDTACSSSLTAIHLAVQSLRAGECDLTVAGGVNVLLTPEFTLHASRMDMLAPDGRCKPFDEHADGFVRSEGCGVVLLKRLADAQADGDRILAVIRAATVNQDGRSNGLTAPNGLLQQAVIREALDQANVPASAISYVETHGTGTSLGDPIEAESIFAALGQRDTPCLIGSAKSNIGHAEGAAGVAGLIKTVLSLQHEAIPPICHFGKLNPHIAQREGFDFPTKLQPWPRAEKPRFAGVSSFGWSGTNAHIVLEEAPAAPETKSATSEHYGPLVLALSAQSETALRAMAASFQQFLHDDAKAELWDICYTAAVRRTHHEYRLAAFGSTPTEMAAQLQEFLTDPGRSSVLCGKVNVNSPSQGVETAPASLSEYGRIYINGADVDWTRAYPAGRLVSLPGYPWQRRRYWFQEEGGRSEPRKFTAMSSPEQPPRASGTTHDWFYEWNWEEKPVPLAEGAQARVALECLAQGYMADAFRAMGFEFEVGQSFSEAALAARLGILPKYGRLFRRMLSQLEEEGCLSRHDGVFEIVRAPDSSSEFRERFGSTIHSDCRQEFGLLERCGRALPEVLRGNADPLELLFSSDSEINASSLYRDSVSLRFYNDLAANLVRQVVAERTGRPLRILEVGAGTGATTVRITQQISHEDYEYDVTDISATLLYETAERLTENNSVRYRVLNIESDPVQQGFAEHAYDVVICANVLHATDDLKRVLGNVRRLLKDDGVLLLLEATAARAWVDLTFGLTDGWWRFADTGLRPSHPLLSAEQWRHVLDASGFLQVETVGAPYSRGTALEECILVACPDAKAKAHPGQARRWAIFADESGLGERLAERLRANNRECTVVHVGHQSEDTIDPAKPQDYAAFFDNLRELDGVVHLWSLDIPSNPKFGLDGMDRAQLLGPGSLLQVAHALEGRAGKLWIVTRSATGPKTNPGISASVGQVPVWGFGRCLAIEQPEAWGGLIDVDEADSDDIADRIMREICDPDGEDQIAWRENRRYAGRLLSASEPPSIQAQFRKDASYLITGGMGALGSELATWMAERGAGQLVLIGRSGLPERSQWDRLRPEDPPYRTVAAIRKAEQSGAIVTVERVDVGDPEAVRALLERIRESGYPLSGVIHCAAEITFEPFASLDFRRLQSTFRAKARGAWILHESTRNQPLDFFILFSSAASQLGARNLAHYSAANLFLNGLADYRRSLNLPALSVNWGEWDGTSILNKQQRDFFSRSGLVPMNCSLGFEAMFRLAAAGVTQRMVADIDPEVLKPAFELRGRRPFLDYLGLEPSRPFFSEPAQPVVAVAQTPTGNRDGGRGASEDDREKIAERVIAEVADVLGIDSPETIDPERGLFAMGMDSLMSVQLRKRLESSFSRTLPKMLTFTYPTVAALISYLSGETAERPKTPQTTKAAAATGAVSLGDIGGLSAAEARNLLLEELDSLPSELKS